MIKDKFLPSLVFLILALAAPNSACLADSADDAVFVRVLQSIADYSTPGIGIDKRSGLPYDHIRIDPRTGTTFSTGTYSAASKIAPYIMFLLMSYKAEGYYKDIKLSATNEEAEYIRSNYSADADNKTLSLLRLKRLLETIRSFFKKNAEAAPYLGGMVPWLSINRDGAVVRDKDLVPLLDNGILSWAYAALLGDLADEKSPAAVEVYKEAKELLDLQNYKLFIDRDKHLFYGEIDAVTGKGNPNYMMKRLWTEDVLSILWGLFTTDIPMNEKIAIWNNMAEPVMEWQMLSGETIHAPKGYVASNHELIWSFLYMPIAKTALKDLFFNSQYLQADYAVRKTTPGLQSVAYAPQGAYMKMGIPSAAEFPKYVQQDQDAIVFGTAVGVFVDRERGGKWLSSLIQSCNLITKYGPLESVGSFGRADILSADSQYLTAAAIGGGVQEETERYLRGNKVNGSDETYYALLDRLFRASYARILKENSIPSIAAPSSPLPLPQNTTCKYDPYKSAPQIREFEILDHLSESNDDRHGSNVYSPKGKNERWVIDDDGMLVRYAISPDYDRYYRFAWWGTYLGKDRPYLAAYTDLSVTIPNDDSEQKFTVYLKREDSSLVKPIPLNTRLKGEISPDGKWKTYTFPLEHRRRFIRYPLTYVSFSVDDPEKSPAFANYGSIRIKSIRLFNRNVKEGQVDIAEAIARVEKLPTFDRPPRPASLHGKQPLFIDSGSIGEATEDLTKEESGLLYFEFEDVNLHYGSSGIWTVCNEMELGDCQFFVFDTISGSVGENPRRLRVEFKYQAPDKERIIFSYDIDFAVGVTLNHDRWSRVVIPLPKNLNKKKINMINFTYDNMHDAIPSGSILISSPVFTNHITSSSSERVQ